jgi:hypothetical protein
MGAIISLATVLGAHERVARACGGCFHEESVPPAERSVVTDHRMAFAITPTQTVLWDQIRYAGDPREFAWVLPVNPGARVELSRDAWFAALDASTQPVITGPSYTGQGYGCALVGCGSAESASSDGAEPGPGQVQLVSQSTVGPYETVTLRATDPNALTDWLHQHGFAIPDSIQATIDAYVSEGFDFIALRLRPDCGQRAMQPVRVVSPGADPSLPLRMVAAGVGATVGITLYVVGEGRYEPQNFPVAKVDYTSLVWDRYQNRSNYEEISQAAMAQAGGRSWIVEAADHALVSPYAASSGVNPGLGSVYHGLCAGTSGGGGFGTPTPPPSPCTGTPFDAGLGSDSDSGSGTDSGPDSGTDSGSHSGSDSGPDSGSDSRSDSGAATASDAGPVDASYQPSPLACQGWDDLDVATLGMHDVWVTRLRAVLPATALSAGDLRLVAAEAQGVEPNQHSALSYADDVTQKDTRKGCAGAPVRHEPFAPLAFGATALLGIVTLLRRRRTK